MMPVIVVLARGVVIMARRRSGRVLVGIVVHNGLTEMAVISLHSPECKELNVFKEN
jgi:hypothetical protein